MEENDSLEKEREGKGIKSKTSLFFHSVKALVDHRIKRAMLPAK